jgi:hypothetical protein
VSRIKKWHTEVFNLRHLIFIFAIALSFRFIGYSLRGTDGSSKGTLYEAVSETGRMKKEAGGRRSGGPEGRATFHGVIAEKEDIEN